MSKPSLYQKFNDWLIPKQTETSLYVIAATFILTPFFVDTDSNFIELVVMFGELPVLNFASLYGIIVLISFVMVIVSSLVPYKIPWSEEFAGWTFVSSLIMLSFGTMLGAQNWGMIFLSFYHVYIALFTFATFGSKKKFEQDAFYKKMPSTISTPLSKIGLATLLIAVIFGYFYGYQDPEPLWAIPISVSLIVWFQLERLFDRYKS